MQNLQVGLGAVLASIPASS